MGDAAMESAQRELAVPHAAAICNHVSPEDSVGSEGGLVAAVALGSKALPLRKRKATGIRSWPRKKKVGANISRDFPWEIILGHLQKNDKGVHALVMLQMVDKNLLHVISSNHLMWTEIFKKFVYYRRAHLNSKVISDWRFPKLILHSFGTGEVPMHLGLIPGDPHYAESLERNAEFCRYVRKAVALKFGRRCGMCGARHRHEPYWGLGMRVCCLCMGDKSITAVRLYKDFGLHYGDLIRKYHHDVYYFEMSPNENDRRVSFTNVDLGRDRGLGSMYKAGHWVMWRPHLERYLDFVEIGREHEERKKAAQRLCAAVQRTWLLALRVRAGQRKRPSIDAILVALNENEKRRVVHPFGGMGFGMRDVLGLNYAFMCEWSRGETKRCQKLLGVGAEWVWSKLDQWGLKVPRVTL